MQVEESGHVMQEAAQRRGRAIGTWGWHAKRFVRDAGASFLNLAEERNVLATQISKVGKAAVPYDSDEVEGRKRFAVPL